MTRVIPKAAQSLRVTVFASEPEFDVKVAEKVIARPPGSEPTSEATIENLPALVTLRVNVAAFPAADGTGVAQAFSTHDIRSGNPGSTVDSSITLNSTVARVTVSPSSVSVGIFESVPLAITAYDADNNIVVTTPGNWTWRGEPEGVAVVSASGATVAIVGNAAGATVMTGTDPESGKTVSVPVSVHAVAGPPGCVFRGQAYGDFCGTDQNGTRLFWNCETGACEEPLVK
jgi:hypothetical protein